LTSFRPTDIRGRRTSWLRTVCVGGSSLLLETWVWTKEERVRQHYVASLCPPLADIVETWSVIREPGTAPREIGSPGGMSSDEAEDLVVGISEGSHVNRLVQIARTMATFVRKTSTSPSPPGRLRSLSQLPVHGSATRKYRHGVYHTRVLFLRLVFSSR
jgi:hypothetical protein